MKALGGPAAVGEWDSATKEKLIPERKDSPMPKLWLRGDAHHAGAIKHPGALTAAAKEHGVSKLQEAEKESHSSNPHIRSRGSLGIRLIKRTV